MPPRSPSPAPETTEAADDRPVYVLCSLAEWENAKATYARLQTDAAWGMQARFRVAAVAAAIANGSSIPALLALEHKVYIESRNYRPRAVAAVEARLPGDPLGALGWNPDLPVPNAAPVSDHGDWLDEVTRPKRQGLP